MAGPELAINGGQPSAKSIAQSDPALDEIQERLWARLLGSPPAVRLSPTDFAWLDSVIYHARQICRAFSPDR